MLPLLLHSQVRAAVIELLEAWVSVAPPEMLFDELVEVLPSPKCVSEGMQVRPAATERGQSRWEVAVVACSSDCGRVLGRPDSEA
jgi:hypothetical protein